MKNPMQRILLVLFTFNYYCIGIFGLPQRPCIARFNGPESEKNLFCVCNSTYCDDFPSLRQMSIGDVDVIETSMAGKRAELTRCGFTPIHDPANGGQRLTITINSTVVYQPILGFGGAMTDCAAINAMALSEATRDQLMNAYFGDEGLAYNMIRVPIGASDFSARVYSYEDTPNDFSMDTFNLTDEDYLMKIPLLQKAIELRKGNIRLFAAPWSSPGWMKTNNNTYYPGFLLDGDRYRTAYAKYFIKFFEFYNRYNVTFWGVSPQNEPTLSDDPTYRQIALYWNSSTEADFVGRFLGPALKNNPVTKNIKLMTLDFNREWLPAFADVFFANPAADKYTDGVAVHWYSDWQYDASPWNLDQTHENHPDKFLLYTEACTGDYSPGRWQNAYQYTRDIIENLNHHVQGWVDWNLNVDMGGGPNFITNWNGAPMLVNASVDEFYKQPHFYAMGHFSKFIIPGSQRIDMTIEKPLNMDGVAFRHPNNHTRVIVLFNYHQSDPLEYTIRDVDLPGWELKYDIQANTIATIVYETGPIDQIPGNSNRPLHCKTSVLPPENEPSNSTSTSTSTATTTTTPSPITTTITTVNSTTTTITTMTIATATLPTTTTTTTTTTTATTTTTTISSILNTTISSILNTTAIGTTIATTTTKSAIHSAPATLPILVLGIIYLSQS